MSNKIEAVNLINKKLNNKTFMSYKDIAVVTNYHPKYILKLKKEILDGTINLIHQNKFRKPVNTITDKEKEYIIDLYKRSNASIRKFSKFYSKHSYSCIYKILKDSNLI